MKRCPQCGQTYNDGSLNFCLMDGTALAEVSDPTVVLPQNRSNAPTVPAAGRRTDAIPRPVPQTDPLGNDLRGAKRSRLPLWIGLIVLMIFAGVAALVGGLLYLSGRGDKAKVVIANTSTSPSPKHSVTPKPSPSPTATVEASPSQDGSPENDNEDTDTGEITPIGWDTAGVAFKNDVGQRYTFECPPSGISGTVWGSDIYTADSSICTAAVHAGLIGMEDGGVVTIEFRPGRQIYGSTARNGITSRPFGEYPKSFVFK